MNDKRQLLCTFSNPQSYKLTIDNISKKYTLYNNSFFVLVNVKNKNELFITYNVYRSEYEKYPNTISIHRKKQTNTLYSLNALNVLIKEECGSLNKEYQINWEYYKNSLIITGDVSCRIIPIEILEIIK